MPIATVMDQQKKIMCIKSDPSGKPITGVKFLLLNADTMDVVETAVSDKDGVFSFHNFDIGNWIIRETAAPEGYSLMEDVHFRVGDDWTQPKPIMCVNIPDHYEFIKTDSEGKPLTGVKFRLEDEECNELGIYETDQDGVVSINGLKPGTYIIREIETLEGFTLSGDVIKIKLDEYYVVPLPGSAYHVYTSQHKEKEVHYPGIDGAFCPGIDGAFIVQLSRITLLTPSLRCKIRGGHEELEVGHRSTFLKRF